MSNEIYFLVGFVVFILLLLALDLGLMGKNSNGTVSVKQASMMSFFVVALSMGFYLILLNFGHLLHGITSMERLQEIVAKHSHPIHIIPNDFKHSLEIYNNNLGLEYITGYIVEYALSVDNIFVMVLIFTAFGVAPRNYHRVLFWGILGAIVMRFIFIFLAKIIKSFCVYTPSPQIPKALTFESEFNKTFVHYHLPDLI